jgi:predicted amino acid racemase
MVGVNNVNPLNLPPSKEVKKIEIQKVVEGFDMEQNEGLENYSTNVEVAEIVGGNEGNLYDNNYDNIYEGQYDNLYSNNETILENLAELSSETHKKNKRNNY